MPTDKAVQSAPLAVQLNEQEITCAVIALRRYEQALLAKDGVELEDALNDLIVVQSLIKKLSDSKRDL